MAQGALPFQYEAETAASGVTALGGLPVYLDLIKASGLDVAIRKHVRVAGEQGWLDLQMIVALIVLNLAGGDGLEDLERLEQDAGFVQVMREVERGLLPRADRRARTREELERRRVMMLHWARTTCGMMGRSPDFMNVTFAAWAGAAAYFAQGRPEFAENMRRYHAYIGEHDLTLTHSLVNLQRSRTISGAFNLQEGTALHMVRETDAGFADLAAHLRLAAHWGADWLARAEAGTALSLDL